jgi:hypothetical protein
MNSRMISSEKNRAAARAVSEKHHTSMDATGNWTQVLLIRRANSINVIPAEASIQSRSKQAICWLGAGFRVKPGMTYLWYFLTGSIGKGANVNWNALFLFLLFFRIL